MENPNFFSAAPRHKRKLDDSDAVVELLHGVSLSPCRKKLRQEFGSTSYSNDFAASFLGVTSPEVESCDQLPNEWLSALPDVDLSEQLLEPLPPAPGNDERAIVLYKPVNPPLFPGGPSSGSQLLLNTSILPAGVLDASSILRSRKEDELSWLQAPKSGVKIVDLSEEEANQSDVVQNNHLAVVPWDANSHANLLASQTAVQPSRGDMAGMSGDDENMGVEAMEEDNDIVNSQPSNASTNFCYEPWQQYGVLQPHCSSLMSSH